MLLYESIAFSRCYCYAGSIQLVLAVKYARNAFFQQFGRGFAQVVRVFGAWQSLRPVKLHGVARASRALKATLPS